MFVSAIFIDSLQIKFTGHPTPEHIITLRNWSGIGLFYPAGPWLIGLSELSPSILLIGLPAILFLTKKTLLIGPSQLIGALVTFSIMSSAIIFHHFTPLGVQTPIEWNGTTPTEFSAALFYSACVSWDFAIIIILLRKDSLHRG